jgi:hypothetical protein
MYLPKDSVRLLFLLILIIENLHQFQLIILRFVQTEVLRFQVRVRVERSLGTLPQREVQASEQGQVYLNHQPLPLLTMQLVKQLTV